MQARRFPSVFVTGLILAVVMAMPGSLAIAELDDSQMQSLRQAASHLKRGQANLRAAQQSARTSDRPATGSRLRLSLMRLKQAEGDLVAAGKLLTKFPAEDQQVAPLVAHHQQLTAAAAQLRAMLTAKPEGDSDQKPADDQQKSDADTPAAERKPASSDAPKLDYRQREKLKAVQFNLRDVQGRVKPMVALIARYDAQAKGENVGDAASKTPVVYGDIVRALNALPETIRKHNFAVEGIEPLPARNPQVEATAKQINEVAATIGAVQSRLAAVERTLGKLAKLENYPDYAVDLQMLQGFTGRYNNFEMLKQQPERLAQIIREDGQVIATTRKLAKTYQPLADQRTEAGERMRKLMQYLAKRRAQFSKLALVYRDQLPAMIDEHLDEAVKIADEAVAQKKPGFFGPGSGIEQILGFADDKILVLSAFDAKAGEAYASKRKLTQTQIDKKAQALTQQIITGNRPPNDNYTGDDRDAIIARAISGWRVQQPDAKILDAAIVSQAWRRETKWVWSRDAFVKVDRSRIQAQLMVVHDKSLAVIRPVNVIKDHLAGDTTIATPVWGIDEPVLPQHLLLREHIKSD